MKYLRKFEAVGAGNLDKVAEAILDFHAKDQSRMDLLTNLHSAHAAKTEQVMREHDGGLRGLVDKVQNAEAAFTALQAKFAAVEADLATKTQPQQFNIGDGGDRSGGSRAQRLRIPDPKMWSIGDFKAKEDGFHSWRDTFELQVGGVWLGLDKCLEHLREEKFVNYEDFLG